MKKRLLSVLLCLAMAATMLAGCGSSEEAEETTEAEETQELTTVRYAVGSGGTVALLAVAEKQGFLEEEGIKLEAVYVDDTEGAFNALTTGKADFLASYGTNLPIQYIASGMDITIFAGHMLTGCMPVFAKEGTEWNGVEDFIGKTVAGSGPGDYFLSGPLLDMGYDAANEVEWLNYDNQQDRVEAVLKGEADYGMTGTGLNYTVANTEGLEILCYASDILPNYSCCRVEAMSDWVNENPDTVKSLLKAMIRAQEYYEDHKDEAVEIIAGNAQVPEESIAIYVNNEHYRLNVDPVKKSVERAWGYLDKLGLLDAEASEINIDDHINTTIYEEALAECIEEHYDEDPTFYDNAEAFFAENN